MQDRSVHQARILSLPTATVLPNWYQVVLVAAKILEDSDVEIPFITVVVVSGEGKDIPEVGTTVDVIYYKDLYGANKTADAEDRLKVGWFITGSDVSTMR